MHCLKNGLNYLLAKMIICIFTTLLACVVWQVLARWMGVNSTFTDEAARFMFIWAGLFGASLAHGQKRHLAIDLFTRKLTANRKKYSEIFIHLLTISFSVFVMVIGGYMAMLNAANQMSSAMHLPMWIVYLAIPVNGLIISFYSMNDLIHELNQPLTAEM
jgi:TRAP-type C4-dicarboxylate transport system permease small subunit